MEVMTWKWLVVCFCDNLKRKVFLSSAVQMKDACYNIYRNLYFVDRETEIKE